MIFFFFFSELSWEVPAVVPPASALQTRVHQRDAERLPVPGSSLRHRQHPVSMVQRALQRPDTRNSEYSEVDDVREDAVHDSRRDEHEYDSILFKLYC